MEGKHREILRKYRLNLCQDLDPKRVAGWLYAHGIIDNEERERIYETRPRYDSTECLLDLLQCKGPRAYSAFCSALDAFAPHLADLIKCGNKSESDEEIENEHCVDLVTKSKMASGGKWEVVGKGGKKRTQHDGKKTKVKAGEMPKIDFKDPLAQSQTLFEAFNEKKKLKEHEPELQPAENGFIKNHTKTELGEVLPDERVPVQEIKKQMASKKKVPAQAKPQKMEQDFLEEAIRKFDVDAMKALLADLENKFPNSQSIWLNEMASFLQLNLKDVPHKDPTFDGKSQDYPSSVITKSLKDFIQETLAKCSLPSTRKLFFEYCITELVSKISKGNSAYGLQIMIQCLAASFPDILKVIKIEQYQDMLHGKKNRPREALAIMWAIAQLALAADLRQGFKVWMQIMLPVLGIKQLAKFAVSHLETLLKPYEFKKRDEPVLETIEFLSIMEVTFSATSPLANNLNLQKKMLALYPRLKALSFSCQPSVGSTLHFPALLKYLGKDLSAEYQQEVLACLVTCLQASDECFQQWIDCYPKNLRESSVLLQFVLKEQERSTHKVPTKSFLHAVKSFQLMNNELVQKDKTRDGLQECIRSCNVVEEKTKKKKSFFSFKRLLKLILFIVFCFVAYDIYKHKSYRASKTGKYLKEIGIEDTAIEGYNHAKNLCSKTNSWAQEKYPGYYQKFRGYYDPAAEFTVEKLTIAGKFVAEKTKPARDYLNEKVPVVIEKVEKELPVYIAIVKDHLNHIWEKYGPVVRHYLNKAWEFIQEYGPIVVARVKEFFETVANTIYELAPDFFAKVAAGLERLGEKISEKLPEVLAMIKEYAVIAFNLAVNLINNVVAAIQESLNSADVDETVTSVPPPQAAGAGAGRGVPK